MKDKEPKMETEYNVKNSTFFRSMIGVEIHQSPRFIPISYLNVETIDNNNKLVKIKIKMRNKIIFITISLLISSLFLFGLWELFKNIKEILLAVFIFTSFGGTGLIWFLLILHTKLVGDVKIEKDIPQLGHF